MALAALSLLPACDVLPPAVAQPTGPRIIVVGDSVTEQAYGYAGGWVDAPSSDVVKIAGSGWDLEDAEPGYGEALAQAEPDVTVVALGPNDADPASGGWDINDVYRWYGFLNFTVPPGGCVVVVLPRHKSGFPPAWAAELNEARDYMVDLASPGGQFAPPGDVTVRMEDWRMRTAANPALLAGDGIHLSGTPAAVVRQHQYWAGVDACEEGSP